MVTHVRERPAPGAIAQSGSVIVLVAMVTIAGCATKPPPSAPSSTPPPVTAPGIIAPSTAPQPIALTRKQKIANALILLNSGQVSTARIGIAEMLAERPDDPVAKDLLLQIDTDPKVLLGERSYSYRIRPRETLTMIAGRLLRNSNRFWALARYNDIAVPANAEAGRTIQIPGVAPVRAAAATVRAPVPSPSEPAVAAPIVAERSVGPKVDAPAAERFRRAGLAEMARGSINKAVLLLERAQTLNPGDAAIQADLARARKVQQTVRGN